jgi:hypothetical protein
MRRLFLICLVLLAVAAVSFGQSAGYGYAGPFPDTTLFKLPPFVVNNGIGVDPEGKVWITPYLAVAGMDSFLVDTTYFRLGQIYVFNPNGTQASFSPIRILTGPDQNNVTVTDTVFRRSSTGGNINRSNGNFVGVWANLAYKPGGLIWEINYKTGQGVRRILTDVTSTNIASVALNQDGEFYICSVLGASPGQILNPDGTLGTAFASLVPAIGRTIAVSPNGNDVYVPRFTAAPPMTYVYHSDNGSLGPYTLADSILLGASVESIAFHPVTGHVWLVADRRSSEFNGKGWSPNTAYAYNPTTKAVVDSFTVQAWDPGATGPLPRGIAFSPTGDTLYIAHFDVPALPQLVRYIKGLGVSVERDNDLVPSGYKLSQNFPNPFNPSTRIQFELASSGMTTLKVYDLMGREVSTLVDKMMEAGSYTATFDAARLPSGTYVYVLTSGAQRLSGKMMLLK